MRKYKPVRKALSSKQLANHEPARINGLKFWMPFDEGSGESFTERVSGQVITSTATSTYAVAHCVNTFCPAQAFNHITVKGNFIAFNLATCVGDTTSGIFYFGKQDSATAHSIWFGYNRGHIVDEGLFTGASPATAGVAVNDAVAGTTYLTAMVRDGNLQSMYRGEDGGAVSVSGDTNDITGMVETLVLGDQVNFGTTITNLQGFYGAALLQVDTVPSDLTIRLQKTSIDWLNGRKDLRHFSDL